MCASCESSGSLIIDQREMEQPHNNLRPSTSYSTSSQIKNSLVLDLNNTNEL